LIDKFRDLKFARKKCRLDVKLSGSERQFAISSDGNAKRVQFVYVADTTLLDSDNKSVIFHTPISVSTSYNISYSHGEVLLSLYGRHNDALLRELCDRIVENIKMALKNEN
jgi:hypothetical protein